MQLDKVRMDPDLWNATGELHTTIIIWSHACLSVTCVQQLLGNV